MIRIVISLLLAMCIAHVQGSDEDFSMSQLRDQIVRDSNCLEKENLTMSDVESLVLGEKLGQAEIEPKLKCFAACLFEHLGIMDNCKLNEDIFADDEMLKDVQGILMSCNEAVDAGETCECAYQLIKCVTEQVGDEEPAVEV